MGCCSPEYRKVVEAQEEKVNTKENHSVPLLAKIVIVLITAGSVLTAIFLM